MQSDPYGGCLQSDPYEGCSSPKGMQSDPYEGCLTPKGVQSDPYGGDCRRTPTRGACPRRACRATPTGGACRATPTTGARLQRACRATPTGGARPRKACTTSYWGCLQSDPYEGCSSPKGVQSNPYRSPESRVKTSAGQAKPRTASAALSMAPSRRNSAHNSRKCCRSAAGSTTKGPIP